MYWWTFCHGQKAFKRLVSNNIKIKATNSVPLVYRIGSFFVPVLLLRAYKQSTSTGSFKEKDNRSEEEQELIQLRKKS